MSYLTDLEIAHKVGLIDPPVLVVDNIAARRMRDNPAFSEDAQNAVEVMLDVIKHRQDLAHLILRIGGCRGQCYAARIRPTQYILMECVKAESDELAAQLTDDWIRVQR